MYGHHLVLASLVSVAACSRATSAPVEVVAGKSVQLAEGSSASVNADAVRVRFVGANDSRCPSDVVCVTAGDAAIILELSGAGVARTDTVYLARTPRSSSYGTFRFEAADLQPYPVSQGTRPARTLTLRVLKAE